MRKFLLASSCISLSVFAAFGYNVSTEPSHKSIVIEEFTGIHCGNCPDGHKRAASLLLAHPGEVFTLAYHAGSYADPSIGEPDFRTPFGTAIHNFLGANYYPCASINRANQGFGLIQGRANWGESGRMMSAQESPVNLYAESSVDATTRELKVNIEAYFTSPMSSPRLTVILLQNNILGPQSGGMLGVEYPHRHAVRMALTTDNYGDPVSVKAKGEYFTRDFSAVLPADINGVPLNVEDLEIVAFISEGEKDIVKATDCFPVVSGIENPTQEGKVFISDPLIPLSNSYGLDYIEMTVNNYSASEVNTATMKVTVDGKSAEHVWNGSVAPHSSAVIRFPMDGALKAAYDGDLHNYNYKVTSINGLDIDFTRVDGTFLSLSEYPADLNFYIRVDNYAASDNTFRIIDENGEVVKEFGPYPDEDPTEYTEKISLEGGKVYGFEVYDVWGNGMLSPRGKVRIMDSERNLVGQMNEIKEFGQRIFFRTAKSEGVEAVAADAIPVATEYYDLAGRRVSAEATGILVVRTIHSDGSVKTSKKIARN